MAQSRDENPNLGDNVLASGPDNLSLPLWAMENLQPRLHKVDIPSIT